MIHSQTYFACGLAVLAALIATFVLLPYLDTYWVISLSMMLSLGVYTLSMALIWGFGGLLCFGQAAFFGLGAYAYSVTSINFGDSTFGVPAAILVPALFASVLGYFVFYGRLSDVYFGAVTLTVTLILLKAANSATGDAAYIGRARLGGFDGMPDTPPVNALFDASAALSPEANFVLIVFSLAAVYIVCRLLLVTAFGRAVVATKENELRAELLGYNVRLLKLMIFVVGAAIAGVGGMFFAETSMFVSPTVFGLDTAAQVLIWVIVGGLGTFIGPLVASVGLQLLNVHLGTLGWIDPNILQGAILILFVMFVPGGVVPMLADAFSAMAEKRMANKSETENAA